MVATLAEVARDMGLPIAAYVDVILSETLIPYSFLYFEVIL